MNKPFDMYAWRNRYVYLAENDKEVSEALMGEQEAIEKFYGDKIVPNTLKYNYKLSRYVAENLEGDLVYFDFNNAGTGFRVYRVEDFQNFRMAAQGLPVADEEYAALKKAFEKKSLDFILFGLSKPQPELEEAVEENPIDIVSMDVPLFIRMLEFAREDASTDMDLHDLAQKAIKMSSEGEPLTMMHYDELVSKGAPVSDAMSLYEKYFNA